MLGCSTLAGYVWRDDFFCGGSGYWIVFLDELSSGFFVGSLTTFVTLICFWLASVFCDLSRSSCHCFLCSFFLLLISE